MRKVQPRTAGTKPHGYSLSRLCYLNLERQLCVRHSSCTGLITASSFGWAQLTPIGTHIFLSINWTRFCYCLAALGPLKQERG